MTSLRGQALLASGLASIVMLLALLGVWQLERETDLANALTARSDLRLRTAELLLLRLVDLETGIRGYAATKDPRFLEPYNAAVLVLPGLITSVASLHPNPEVRAETATIARGARTQSLLLARIRKILENGGSSSVPVALLRGKKSMDAIRGLIVRYDEKEHAFNLRRRAQYAASRARLNYAISGVFLLTIAMGIMAIFFFTNRVVRRLAEVISKTELVAADKELGVPLRGNDEISAVDRAVHSMAAVIREREAMLNEQYEELNRRNAQLDVANTELERSGYSISHDLRSPVRAISAYARLLDEGYGESLDAEGRRLLGILRGESERMGQLIDDLLRFLGVGQLKMTDALVDMTVLAREVADEVKKAGGNGVTLSVATLPQVRGDRALLRQVWTNLIENAIKYSSTRAKPEVAISGSAADSVATYIIRDNGVGFDMKYVDKLFGLFHRLHGADEFPGTGVGLAIVRRIVARQGGRAWAYADPDAGATFSFSLPIRE